MDYQEVADLLLCSERSIRRYEELYFEGGLQALLSDKRGGSSGKLSEEQKEQLKATLKETIFRRAKDIKRHIKRTFDVDYSISGVHHLLGELGFVYKKPKVSLMKASPEKQAKFLENIEEIQDSMGDNDKLYHTDGAHFQFTTEVSYGWIEKGKDKLLPAQTGRKRVNVHGALDLETDQVIAREESTLNAESFIRLLQDLEQANPAAAKIHVVLDNASYHRNKKVKKFLKTSRIRLHFLPPYSPNLNLIERIWGFTKRTLIYNQYFDDYEEFSESIIHFLRNMHLNFKEELISLLEQNFQVPMTD